MISYVCTLHNWIFIQGDEIPWIIDVLAVFINLDDAIEYSESYDFKNTDKWIEIYEFDGNLLLVC